MTAVNRTAIEVTCYPSGHILIIEDGWANKAVCPCGSKCFRWDDHASARPKASDRNTNRRVTHDG